MLFSFLVLILVTAFIFMYLGATLSVKIENSPYKKIFWVLLFITFITVLEIIFCIFLYVKFRQKHGEEGPMGFQGHPGDKGDKGKCPDSCKGDKGKCPDSCKVNTIKVMIQKIFEEKLGRILTNEERNDLYTKLSGIITPDNVNSLTLKQVKELHKQLTRKIELGYIKLDTIDLVTAEINT